MFEFQNLSKDHNVALVIKDKGMVVGDVTPYNPCGKECSLNYSIYVKSKTLLDYYPYQMFDTALFKMKATNKSCIDDVKAEVNKAYETIIENYNLCYLKMGE